MQVLDSCPADDPKGHWLFSQRCQLSIDRLKHLFKDWDTLHSSSPGRDIGWVITGIGSSEAHGRFLAKLAHPQLPQGAEFRPLSSFAEGSLGENEEGKTLILFSQGLSPNARFALEAGSRFRRVVLFTACDPTGSGDKSAYLRSLQDSGVEVVFMPETDEYTILIRIIGPLAGFAASLIWLKKVGFSGEYHLPGALFDALDMAWKKGEQLFEEHQKYLNPSGRLGLLGLSPWPEVGMNLSYKIMEGLFLAPPIFWDAFQFSHGPFQEALRSKTPHFLIGSVDQENSKTARACRNLLTKTNAPTLEFWTQHAFPWGIFELELAFNGFLNKAIRAWELDQINWPGKGKDDALYQLTPDNLNSSNRNPS